MKRKHEMTAAMRLMLAPLLGLVITLVVSTLGGILISNGAIPETSIGICGVIVVFAGSLTAVSVAIAAKGKKVILAGVVCALYGLCLLLLRRITTSDLPFSAVTVLPLLTAALLSVTISVKRGMGRRRY